MEAVAVIYTIVVTNICILFFINFSWKFFVSQRVPDRGADRLVGAIDLIPPIGAGYKPVWPGSQRARAVPGGHGAGTELLRRCRDPAAEPRGNVRRRGQPHVRRLSQPAAEEGPGI